MMQIIKASLHLFIYVFLFIYYLVVAQVCQYLMFTLSF